MMDLISCYNDYSLQISQSSSCTNSSNFTTSIQTSATSLYKTTLSSGHHHLISVTWSRSAASHGLHIAAADDPSSAAFRLNTHSRLFRKKKGSKSFQTATAAKFDIFYDLSTAVYAVGAEPVEGFYVVIIIDSEIGFFIGDFAAVKRLKPERKVGNFSVISRREHFSGDTHYATKAQFSDAGVCHDIVIRCTGEMDGSKHPVLMVCVDKRVVIRVKRLQWNFRGNQTIFLDGLLVDLMWDVHDWFFQHGSGSGSGSGHGVFMFRTRSGLDSRLWLEEKVVKRGDQKNEFSFLICATKS